MFTYDVFLSFKGETGTRYSFTDHLYRALLRHGINAFRDSENLRSGDEIRPALLDAIKNSTISMVVLCQNYASSAWCLDELVKIIGCHENGGTQVLAVFYRVEPSDVRYLKNSYATAMTTHEKRYGKESEKMTGWRSALLRVCDLRGEHCRDDMYESELIEKIVKHTLAKLPPTPFQTKHQIQKQINISTSKEVKEVEEFEKATCEEKGQDQSSEEPEDIFEKAVQFVPQDKPDTSEPSVHKTSKAIDLSSDTSSFKLDEVPLAFEIPGGPDVRLSPKPKEIIQTDEGLSFPPINIPIIYTPIEPSQTSHGSTLQMDPAKVETNAHKSGTNTSDKKIQSKVQEEAQSHQNQKQASLLLPLPSFEGIPMLVTSFAEASQRIPTAQASTESSLDIDEYEKLLEVDPLAVMQKIIAGEVNVSSLKATTSTKSSESTCFTPINILLTQLREIAFSVDLTQVLLVDANLKKQIRHVIETIEPIQDQLTPIQKKGLGNFYYWYQDLTVAIDGINTVNTALHKAKLDQEEIKKKLINSNGTIRNIDEAIQLGSSQREVLNGEITNLELKLAKLKEEAKKLEEAESKCEEKWVDTINDIKVLSSNALKAIKLASSLELQKKKVDNRLTELQGTCKNMKAHPPF